MTDDTTSSETFRNRPVLVMVMSHWVSMAGMFLVATALITWIFVLPLHVRGRAPNPYIGIIVFMVVPIMFLAGLVSVPLGIYLARRQVRTRLAAAIVDRSVAVRRLAVFLGVRSPTGRWSSWSR
jgi:asparagine N-glycosylation enzyme membrane subunit Stt3